MLDRGVADADAVTRSWEWETLGPIGGRRPLELPFDPCQVSGTMLANDASKDPWQLCGRGCFDWKDFVGNLSTCPTQS